MRLLSFLSFKKQLDMTELKKAQMTSAELVNKKLKLAKLEELDEKLLKQLKGTQKGLQYTEEIYHNMINREKQKLIKELEQTRDSIKDLKIDIEKDEVFLKVIKQKTDLIIKKNKNKITTKEPMDNKSIQNQKNILFNNIKTDFKNVIEYYKKNCVNENITNTLLIIDMISNHIDIILKEESSLKNSIESSKKFLSLLKNRICKLSQEELNNIFSDYINLLTDRKLTNNNYNIIQLFN
jgi:hypothetical protein